MNTKVLSLALLVLSTATSADAANITRTVYKIQPNGQYTYKPSPWSQGFPGGVPNPYQLDFAVSGTFLYELDWTVPSARLLFLNLNLTGNEAIQADPPSLEPVTADRVEAYLASHTFVEDFIGGLLHLESSIHEGLKLTDGLNGNLALHGGFDATPVDGTAMLFNFSAVVLPDLPGDTNADRVVDMTDLNNVRNNLGGHGLGDVSPFDGDVDLDDLNAVRNNFGAVADGEPVPEPATLALQVIGALSAAWFTKRLRVSAARTPSELPV